MGTSGLEEKEAAAATVLDNVHEEQVAPPEAEGLREKKVSLGLIVDDGLYLPAVNIDIINDRALKFIAHIDLKELGEGRWDENVAADVGSALPCHLSLHSHLHSFSRFPLRERGYKVLGWEKFIKPVRDPVTGGGTGG